MLRCKGILITDFFSFYCENLNIVWFFVSGLRGIIIFAICFRDIMDSGTLRKKSENKRVIVFAYKLQLVEMKKKILLLLVSVLTVVPLCRAQYFRSYGKNNYGSGSGLGTSVMYDMQLRNSVNGTGVPSNIGAAVYVNIPVTYIWTIRANAKLYGIVVHDGYDRCAAMLTDLLFCVNNAISGGYSRGSCYLMAGAGITYAVDGIDGLGMAVNAGIGYTYWIAKRFGVNAEVGFDLIGISKISSANLGVGCVIKL